MVICLLPRGKCYTERSCSQAAAPSAPCSLERLSYPSLRAPHPCGKGLLPEFFSFLLFRSPDLEGVRMVRQGKARNAAKFPQGRKTQPSLDIQLWGDDHSCAAAAAAELNKSPCREG